MGSRSGGAGLKAILVVAILAVVGVLLHPRLDTRDAKRKASCMGDMSRLGLALMLYVQDYDGNYAPSKICEGSQVANRQVTRTIVDLLDPYVMKRARPTRGVWRCPAQPGHALYVKTQSDETAVAGTVWPMHYVCNINLLRPMGGVFSHYRYLTKAERTILRHGSPSFVVEPNASTDIAKPVNVADVRYPSLTLAILDWHQTGDKPDACIDASAWYQRRNENVQSLNTHPSYVEGLMTCYADGHVGWRNVDYVERKQWATFYPDEAWE
jgi:hypothetical protein